MTMNDSQLQIFYVFNALKYFCSYLYDIQSNFGIMYR
jgi:hypothetical protein